MGADYSSPNHMMKLESYGKRDKCPLNISIIISHSNNISLSVFTQENFEYLLIPWTLYRLQSIEDLIILLPSYMEKEIFLCSIRVKKCLWAFNELEVVNYLLWWTPKNAIFYDLSLASIISSLFGKLRMGMSKLFTLV